MFILRNKRTAVALAVIALVSLTGLSEVSAATQQAQVKYLNQKITTVQAEKAKIDAERKKTLIEKAQVEKAAQDKDQQIKDLNSKLQAKLDAQKNTAVAQVSNFVAPAAYASGGGGNIESIIRKWASINGISGDWAVGIARCESGFNLQAHNASGATGLFQFMPSTFYGNGGTSIYDADDQSRVATYMLAHGQAGQWVCK